MIFYVHPLICSRFVCTLFALLIIAGGSFRFQFGVVQIKVVRIFTVHFIGFVNIFFGNVSIILYKWSLRSGELQDEPIPNLILTTLCYLLVIIFECTSNLSKLKYIMHYYPWESNQNICRNTIIILTTVTLKLIQTHKFRSNKLHACDVSTPCNSIFEECNLQNVQINQEHRRYCVAFRSNRCSVTFTIP